MFGAGSILGRVHKYLDLDLDFAARRRRPLCARARARPTPAAAMEEGAAMASIDFEGA